MDYKLPEGKTKPAAPGFKEVLGRESFSDMIRHGPAVIEQLIRSYIPKEFDKYMRANALVEPRPLATIVAAPDYRQTILPVLAPPTDHKDPETRPRGKPREKGKRGTRYKKLSVRTGRDRTPAADDRDWSPNDDEADWSPPDWTPLSVTSMSPPTPIPVRPRSPLSPRSPGYYDRCWYDEYDDPFYIPYYY